jgi:hypothetical protein
MKMKTNPQKENKQDCGNNLSEENPLSKRDDILQNPAQANRMIEAKNPFAIDEDKKNMKNQNLAQENPVIEAPIALDKDKKNDHNMENQNPLNSPQENPPMDQITVQARLDRIQKEKIKLKSKIANDSAVLEKKENIIHDFESKIAELNNEMTKISQDSNEAFASLTLYSSLPLKYAH